MRFFDSLAAIPEGFGPSAVTIGKFDGVHAGHRRIVGELRSVAEREGLTTTVVTFDRHPLALLNPGACPAPLVSNAQKVQLLAETGVDATVMLAFDRAFADQSPEQFVRSILVDALHARVVMVGSDFRYGARGSGDVAELVRLGGVYGFTVQLIEDVVSADADHTRRASSTWVRELLATGRVAEATAVLGHQPKVRGVIVRGAQRGRELGYPTANLSPDMEGFIPGDGVYAAWFTLGGHRYGAAVSIGNNPTFDGVPARQVEAYVLDESFDMYGQTAEVAFVEYIRGMVKYSTIEALIEQIADDEAHAREVLGYAPRVAPAQPVTGPFMDAPATAAAAVSPGSTVPAAPAPRS